ncbi:MAG: hypothetical protein ABOK23_03500 [Candidatus Methanoperedens sp.]|nr:hypothetical protein [Candidatus Methanoperedens sp.]MCZ7395807.1 hypothetical protein [Candidatus Methanoperedens sp.]
MNEKKDIEEYLGKAVEIYFRPNQLVGNVGLYYICYELSKRDWNVLPTSRNAKGIDIVIYNQNATRTHTIQVKALSKKSPVPGMKKDSLIAEYLIVCRNVFDEKPEVFISKTDDIKDRIHEGMKEGRRSYWLQPKDYEEFKDNWDIIGDGCF